MEFLKLIEERRSIRAYKSAEISKEDIDQMIYAAQQAPSWKNSQTGRYYVALSAEAVREVRESCLPSFNFERTANVSAFIITAFKRGISGFAPDGAPTDEHGNGDQHDEFYFFHVHANVAGIVLTNGKGVQLACIAQNDQTANQHSRCQNA